MYVVSMTQKQENEHQEILESCLSKLFFETKQVLTEGDSEITASLKSALENITLDYCILEKEHKNVQTALKMAKQKCTDTSVNFISIYKNELKKLQEQNDERETDHPFMVKLKQVIDEYGECVQEDSLITLDNFQIPIDPISKVPITDPLKNIICGHIYQSDVIQRLMKTNKKLKCPYVGCPARDYLKKSDLRADDELKEKISNTQSTKDEFDGTVLSLDTSSEI